MSKNCWLHLKNSTHRFSKREQNFQACLNVLPNSAEFSAKVLQNLCPYKGNLVSLLAKVLITGGQHIDGTRACAGALWVFRKNKCRSVYSLSIKLLGLFLSDIKCRLFVGKIWVIFFLILYCVLRSNSMCFAMFCIAFYVILHCILRCFSS